MGQQEFRARSGRVVKVQENGAIVFDHVNGYITSDMVMDAEEFFQAKRDEERGRWRSPLHASCIVKEGESTGDFGQGRTVYVFHEETFDRFHFNERVLDATARTTVAHQAAREYFEAHPERKPWEDAKTGDAWVLHFPAGPAVAVRRHDGHFYDYEGNRLVMKRVREGRRIWPEDAS